MTFACITTALVLGGVAERAKFCGRRDLRGRSGRSLVYYPMAHMVWWWGWPDSWRPTRPTRGRLLTALA